jgi:hypothetical protein
MLAAFISCALITPVLADPPVNDDCADATDAGTLINGETADLTGAVTDAGQDCDSTDGAEVWVKFTINDCMDVTIDFCETVNYVADMAASYLFDECPCGNKIDASNDGSCLNYNPEFIWYNLPAGTYYYPIIAGAVTGDGTYTISITGEDCPEAPANDDCANATAVGEVTELAYTTHGAIFDGESTCMSAPNVWYIYTSTFTGNARVSLIANYSEKLAIYDGVDCSSLPTELGCTNGGYLDIAVVSGNQYLIEVGGTNNFLGDGTLTIGVVPEPPSNDDCADADNAGILESGKTVQVTGTVEEATTDCYDLDYPEVWIKFTVLDYMDVTIDFCDISEMVDMLSTSMKLISDCPCGSFTNYDNDSYCFNNNISYTWNYLPAGTYYYPIYNSGAFSSYTINIIGEESTLPTGACCTEGEITCYSDVTADSCENYLYGTWMGNGSECTDSDENGIADVCEEPSTGACCMEDGMFCSISSSEEECVNDLMGTWMGEGSTCGDYDEETGWSGCNQTQDYEYLPGDANMINGQWPPKIIGADVTYLVGYFRGINGPCLVGGFYNSADANGDCNIIGSDVTRLVSYFRGLSAISHCADYPPAWLVPGDCPPEAPAGWPNCEDVPGGE